MYNKNRFLTVNFPLVRDIHRSRCETEVSYCNHCLNTIWPPCVVNTGGAPAGRV